MSTAASSPAHARESDGVSLRAWVAVLGGVFGCFMAGMNVHVTNASLPDIRGSLGASFEEGSWITTAYLVAEIIVIPLTGWLVQVFSARRVLLVGTAGFLVFSLACSLAPDISTMIVARALQGAFGGVLIPLSFQLIVSELPPSRHPLGMALFAVANNVAQAAGPSLGGWLTQMYSWRWIFYLQIPPGVVLLAAIGWSIKPTPVHLEQFKRADWFGIGAMAIGLSALQIVLEEGGRKDWFASTEIVQLSIVAAIGLAAFAWTQWRRAEPFINLRLLARYNFGVASLMQFLFGAVVFGVVFLVPNYFAELHGFSARDIGLTMIPYGAVQFVMSFLTPPLMRRIGPRTTIVAGFALVAAGCLMNVHLNIDAGVNVIEPSLIVRGVGQSLVVVALSVMAVAGIEKTQVGSASGLFAMVRNVGGAIGIAVASQIVVERQKLHAMRIGEAVTPYADAFRDRMHAMEHWMAKMGVAGAQARDAALGLIEQRVMREALFMAYSDTFLIAGVAMLGCTAAALLLRAKAKPAAAS
ncbi:DHA2 family efflux MFS transporter permease subunit [Pandoraea nosoerga]|uniref:EmrB/QacA family drug resistance transporter n=1 Tax=Pandoraea nosoerga TaxID=2508296 RepID=A0A5E4WFS2_9BURK|nr:MULTISPECIES: DHA2 family efflux MFS transporter permease subunit [Pandoraea]MBN4665921.1 DHA2 family efflux MFS transporter permease subunit [Pandoraea nosoerga]MBN4676095.1 DHA2 family efflux MFS transporter permease subunit [Pandoraea nosoerga]MBN4682496.1 DHA2 family efflux MFS transporter permease subunit [Pandoraea nosoerga]MBN4745037.1 DHA2 family efflux MFS transporter permease subunit [Pandoraea nosoerga]VVE21905.1 EmrB/QacA family drug resistance transporter [Pandoraea nosoerga]